jgi:Tfp pilus assembly protein PilN
VYIIGVLIGLCGILGLVIYLQSKRIQHNNNENAALQGEIQHAAEKLEQIRDYTAKNKMVEEDANEERQSLKETADDGLVDRANALFGGVRDTGGSDGVS